MADQSIGQQVRAAREGADLSREHLARATEISTATLVRLELNDRIPNALALARIAAALHLSLDDLMAGAGPGVMIAALVSDTKDTVR